MKSVKPKAKLEVARVAFGHSVQTWINKSPSPQQYRSFFTQPLLIHVDSFEEWFFWGNVAWSWKICSCTEFLIALDSFFKNPRYVLFWDAFRKCLLSEINVTCPSITNKAMYAHRCGPKRKFTLNTWMVARL